MAKKKLEEPERWITVNGQHLPVYPGGRIGAPGQEEPEKDTTSKNNNHRKDAKSDNPDTPKTNREWFDHFKKTGEIDKDAEYHDFVSYAPITDKEAERIVKRGKQMELADEADAYDRAHNEGKYANTTDAKAKTNRAIDVNGKKIGINGKETHAQAIYRQAQEEQGLPVDKKFYKSLGETQAPVGHETSSSNDGWKKGQNYTGSYTKKEEAMSDKEYEKSVYDRLRKNGWSEKMAKAEAAEQVKVRNDDLGGVRPAKSSTTSRNADDIYNERKNIKGNTQEEATRREKLSEELSRTVVSGMKSGEVYKVPSGKGYEELRYVGSEMKNNRAYATFETPNKSRTGIVKEGSDLYGIQSMKSSKPATTSRNAKYDTSRSNKKETTGTKKSTLSDSTLSNMSTSKLEELLKNSSNLTGAQLSTIRSILKKRKGDEDLYRQSLRW